MFAKEDCSKRILPSTKTFSEEKNPGNDGLMVEFYLGFWPLVGKSVVTALNFSHQQV